MRGRLVLLVVLITLRCSDNDLALNVVGRLIRDAWKRFRAGGKSAVADVRVIPASDPAAHALQGHDHVVDDRVVQGACPTPPPAAAMPTE